MVQFINDSILFELLEDIQDNNSIYQYCLSFIIENYSSKMKELYFKPTPKFKECRNYLKISKKLYGKITDPKAIEPGIKTEIELFEVRIKIKEFILDLEKGKINSLEANKMALLFKMDVSNNISFFYNEIKELSKINKQFEDIKDLKQKLNKTNDAEYLYEKIKFCPPKRRLPFIKIKSEEDINEEIKKFKGKFGKPQKDSDKERKELKEDEENERLFKKILSEEGILENEKILTYKRERLKQEENHRKINDKFFNKFDKYCNNYSNETEAFS